MLGLEKPHELDPRLAPSRRTRALARLQALDARIDIDAAIGISPPDFRSPLARLRRLLEAEIDFAEAQIAATEAGMDASAASAASAMAAD